MERGQVSLSSIRHRSIVRAFRPKEAITVLEREGVEYVVIGGLASILHGANTAVNVNSPSAVRGVGCVCA